VTEAARPRLMASFDLDATEPEWALAFRWDIVLRGQGAEGFGTMGTAALGLPNPLGLAGHAWEGSSTHPVMAESLERLWAYLDGSYAPLAGEVILDDGLGQLPP
jgi:hypothetical protein